MSIRHTIINALAPKPKIAQFNTDGFVLYGDSIMNNGVAERIRAKLPRYPISDRSVPGDTAYEASIRFKWELRNAHTVVLEHGTNDIPFERDPTPYLELMAKHALAEGRVVIFTGILLRPQYMQTCLLFNKRIHDLADDLKCRHAQWDGIVYPNLVDGLHPAPDTIDRMTTYLVSASNYKAD